MKKLIYLTAIALTVTACGKQTSSQSGQDSQDTTASADSFTVADVEKDSFTVNNTTYKMIKVDGGKFAMGASAQEKGLAGGDEYPAHNVNVSSFFIGQLEVTQKLWKDVMGNNPSETKGDNNPVDNVSWEDCNKFIAKLNKLTGKTFRMPTEAEWEFAARGGNFSKGFLYAGSDNIDKVAWYSGNDGDKTHEVGKKQPNEIGIYDMSGNVGEWCSDWYEDGFYAKSGKDDPKGPKEGDYHVLRGNGWYASKDEFCRIANRSGNEPGYQYKFLGLRLAMNATPKSK